MSITASFTASPASGEAPLSVQFTDTSTGATIVKWLWDFGDGSISTARNPMHEYTGFGSKTVRLWAFDATDDYGFYEAEDFIDVEDGDTQRYPIYSDTHVIDGLNLLLEQFKRGAEVTDSGEEIPDVWVKVFSGEDEEIQKDFESLDEVDKVFV